MRLESSSQEGARESRKSHQRAASATAQTFQKAEVGQVGERLNRDPAILWQRWPVLTKALPDWNADLLPLELHQASWSSSALASCTVAQKPADGIVGHGVSTAKEAPIPKGRLGSDESKFSFRGRRS